MTTIEFLRRAKSGVLNLAFPPVCAGCETAGTFLCDRCGAAMRPATEPRCSRCWDVTGGSSPVCLRCTVEPPSFDALRAPYTFAGSAREAVHRLKYGGLAAAGGALAERIAEAWPGWGLEAGVVVPTPLHPRRERTRGYNQAAELARPLARAIGLPYAAEAIRRVRGTRPLAARLDRVERRRELASAFAPGAEAELVRGRTALLVDDVATSGATLSSAAEALRAAGAVGVVAVAFARDDSSAPGTVGP